MLNLNLMSRYKRVETEFYLKVECCYVAVTHFCHMSHKFKKYMSYKSDSFSGWLVSVSPETIVSSVCESAILFSSFATQSNLKVDDFLTDKTKCHTHNRSISFNATVNVYD